MEASKKGYLLASHGICLSKKMCPKTLEERKWMSEISYILAVRSIMYAMLCTRPDIAYALGIASRFQADPEKNHLKAVKNILKYLKKTKNIVLIYGGGSELKLQRDIDSSFQSNSDDSKSILRYVFILNDGTVSWKSSK